MGADLILRTGKPCEALAELLSFVREAATDERIHIDKEVGCIRSRFRTSQHRNRARARARGRLIILDKVWRHCEASGVRGRTVTLKVEYADFRQITRALSGPRPVDSRAALEGQARRLPADLAPDPRGVRFLGVTLSRLASGPTDETGHIHHQLAFPL